MQSLSLSVQASAAHVGVLRVQLPAEGHFVRLLFPKLHTGHDEVSQPHNYLLKVMHLPHIAKVAGSLDLWQTNCVADDPPSATGQSRQLLPAKALGPRLRTLDTGLA
jgi:hypothetical protein